MSIKTIVVDNSIDLKEKLTKILNEIDGVEVCASFDEAIEAMCYVKENPVDMVFPTWSCRTSAESAWRSLSMSFRTRRKWFYCPAFPDFP